MCGIVSEGIDPHASSLIYQLRIISRDESAPSPSDQGWAAHPLHDARNSPRNLPPSRLPPAPVRRELPTEVKGTVSASEAAGFKVYQARCMGCHTLGNGPLLGPDLLGSHTKPVEVLTARRGP